MKTPQRVAVETRGGESGARKQPEVVSRIPEQGRIRVWPREVEM